VVHTAGVARPSRLAETTLSDLAEVVGAKMNGAARLDDLLGAEPLDAFVLFSSAAGVWGDGCHAAYAAANAYLDALAEHRRSRGLSATSLAWGYWDGGGMADVLGSRQHLSRQGFVAMPADLAIAAMREAIDRGRTTQLVAAMDWELFVPFFTLARPSPLLSDMLETPETAEGNGCLDGQLAVLADEDRRQHMLDLVRTQTATILGCSSADEITPDSAFADLGVDSLAAVELRARLTEATGLRLPATLAFDHPTPRAVAAFISSTRS
jgi:acyl carrier protein